MHKMRVHTAGALASGEGGAQGAVNRMGWSARSAAGVAQHPPQSGQGATSGETCLSLGEPLPECSGL